MSLLSWFKNKFARRPIDLEFAASAITDRGLARKDNQDAFLSMPELGFFSVADGMGGCSNGALASKWICEALAEACPKFVAEGTSGVTRVRCLNTTLQQVNARIRAYIHEKGLKAMGATVALLLSDSANRSHAVIAHAGDSRVYRLRKELLRCLTRDHTVGEELSRKASSRREAASLGARSNPLTHILTRAVGTEYKVRAAWKRIDVMPGDRFLICSDGVHDMLDDGQIAAVMNAGGTPEQISMRLESEVVAAGAGDNYSIVCIEARAKRA